jgi:hypothetical protein
VLDQRLRRANAQLFEDLFLQLGIGVVVVGDPQRVAHKQDLRFLVLSAT